MTNGIAGLLAVPVTAIMLTCAGFGLNEEIYFSKQKATIEDFKRYEQNNKDMFYVALGTAVLTGAIGYAGSKEKKRA